ncbi:DUF397 domain-containing protein [Streptomyces longisporoflavus]|uniref:DUF397 domain-containing protein n=1 Tax=Streptomyces longisporoflavus TaxID=28044 RepID=A0ABW7QEV3_9ACTN
MTSGTAELVWFKSSYSGSQGDDCVEIGIAEQAVHVRDSKDVARPAFAVGRDGWGRFVRFASER